MKTSVAMLTAMALAAVLSLLSGCTYVCHKYDGFAEVIEENDWKIVGRVIRDHAEGKAPTKYSLPHWGSRHDDRYSLKLTPIAPDSLFWDDKDVVLKGVRVIAEKDTIRLPFMERINTYDIAVAERKKPHSPGGYYRKIPYSDWYDKYGRELASQRFTFVSEYFPLRKPVPDILTIEYELVIVDKATREPISSWKFRSEAIVDRHRRWVVVDGIES